MRRTNLNTVAILLILLGCIAHTCSPRAHGDELTRLVWDGDRNGTMTHADTTAGRFTILGQSPEADAVNRSIMVAVMIDLDRHLGLGLFDRKLQVLDTIGGGIHDMPYTIDYGTEMGVTVGLAGELIVVKPKWMPRYEVARNLIWTGQASSMRDADSLLIHFDWGE